MSDMEKRRFNMLADSDKKRYEHEMKTFKPQEEKGKKRTKKVKDPNAPKRPQSSYFLYMNATRWG